MVVENHVIKSLYTNQVAYWLERGIDRQSTLDVFEKLNLEKKDFFIYQFDNGTVNLADKPEITGARILAQGVDGAQCVFNTRAVLYHRFFSRIAREKLGNESGFLGMSMHDMSQSSSGIPFFCFQKRLHERSILLPDIDFSIHDCYEAPQYEDAIPYSDKEIGAIFVGSTTGAIHTKKIVAGLESPRLRAGVRFRNEPGVDFHLPVIVQCDSSETEALIRELGFGDERPIGWQEQFRRRFVISMDGNGATCSRVAIALKSNCALLKYDSPFQLFYFSALIPWLHYIPIKSDEDIPRIIRLEKKNPGYFDYIGAAGADFHRRYLTPESIMDYTSCLLRAYFSSFRNSPAWIVAPEPGRDSGEAAMPEPVPRPDHMVTAKWFSILAHLSNLGDTRVDETGWPGLDHSIEGLALLPKPPYKPEDIRYKVVYHNGSFSDWHKGGEFCGTRGKGQPLRGICVELSGAMKTRFSGTCLATDNWGGIVGPMELGKLCLVPEGLYLCSVSLELQENQKQALPE